MPRLRAVRRLGWGPACRTHAYREKKSIEVSPGKQKHKYTDRRRVNVQAKKSTSEAKTTDNDERSEVDKGEEENMSHVRRGCVRVRIREQQAFQTIHDPKLSMGASFTCIFQLDLKVI